MEADTNYFNNGVQKSIRLYHGSKGGIKGEIKPISRKECDFGKGFYMGTEEPQSKTLISGYPEAKIYELSLNTAGLKVLELKADLNWAYFIAYNHGRLKDYQNTSVYSYCSRLAEDADVMSGLIADDRMFVVLEKFFNNEITDKALLQCIAYLKLGKQYVALTEKACRQIRILSCATFDAEELHNLQIMAENNRKAAMEAVEEICIKYRRDGLYFDEILKGENL